MERAGAPEQHEREVAGVVAALHREHANRFRHRGIADGMDAERHLREAALHRLGEGADRAFRRIDLQANATGEPRGIEVAQHEARIGHGGGGPAASVAGRAGTGTRALRPDLEHPRVVEPRDAPAPRSDGVDVDHRHPERIAANASLARDERRPTARERHVRARPADVEGDEIAPARALPCRTAAQRTCGGTAQQGGDGPRDRPAHGGGTAARLHDQERRANAAAPERTVEPVEVAVDDGSHVGVERGDAGALVLAEDRIDLG